MKSRRDVRIFWVSFFSTLCVLGLILGLLVVDCESRRIGFGDNKTLIYEITGKNLNLSCNNGKLCYNNSVSLTIKKLNTAARLTEDF
jgi:hypothetical protein